MTYFLFILSGVILPIFVQVVLGFGVHKWAKLDIKTLTKVQFYYFIPAFMFINLATAQIPGNMILRFFTVSASLMATTALIGIIISFALKYSKSLRNAFINSLIFFNSGNICIPLINLLYNDPIAITAQLCVLIFQNIMGNSIGILSSSSGKAGLKGAIINIIKMPMLYAVFAGFAVNYFGIELWTPIKKAMEISGEGMVPLALFTLGAQLANTKFNIKMKAPLLSTVIRLTVCPFIAFAFVKIVGLTGIPAQVFVICASAPTAVNTLLLAVQFNNEPDYASQTVLISTLLSTFSLTASIYLVMNYIH